MYGTFVLSQSTQYIGELIYVGVLYSVGMGLRVKTFCNQIDIDSVTLWSTFAYYKERSNEPPPLKTLKTSREISPRGDNIWERYVAVCTVSSEPLCHHCHM